MLKVVSIPFIVIGIHFIMNYHQIQIEGINEEVFCLINGEDTRYSSDFSNRNFRKIEIGMNEKQVLELLGKPLTRFSYSEKYNIREFENLHLVGFKHSDSPESKNYHLRIIHFEFGKVVRVMGELYHD